MPSRCAVTNLYNVLYTVNTQQYISTVIRAQLTPSAAANVPVSHALPAVRFSCLLRGCGASFQDGVAAGKGFLCVCVCVCVTQGVHIEGL